jgi:EAL domain-containing protein (putative c-di-GMP-specific phosphodiesterase class I)
MPNHGELTGVEPLELPVVPDSGGTSSGIGGDPAASDQLFRVAMRSAGIGMCLTAPDGTFLEVDPALAAAGWCDRFLDTLGAGGIDPRRVTIELTETAILHVLDDTRVDIQRCRDLGVGIHIDDFGTGYSSLSLLQSVPATGLKLDISFTRGLLTDNRARVVSAALANLATGLGIDGIAERVETPEQAEVLIDQGWRYAQGYLFGRPSPPPRSSESDTGTAWPQPAPGNRQRSVTPSRA